VEKCYDQRQGQSFFSRHDIVADMPDCLGSRRHNGTISDWWPWTGKHQISCLVQGELSRPAGRSWRCQTVLSQKNCSHCQAFIDTTLSDPVIQERVQKNYDVIALDIFNDLELTDIDGSVSTIKNFAEKQRARFTPTLLFYGVEGARLFKIIGFYPPAKFNRVLDYVEGGDYQRETLGQYLQKDRTVTGQQDIQYDFTLFSRPPYLLDRARFKGQQPILVFFETPDCNPCQRFHEGALNDKNVRRLMPEFEAVQLNSLDNISKVKVPSGRVLTPQQWSNELQLAYDYSVIFFDENGVEVHRLDAETGKDRMSGSMQYVLEKSYLQHEQFLQWRKENVMKKR
jgi:thioredoxin-related protein